MRVTSKPLDKVYKNPKLYVLTIIVNSPLPESDMITLSESFVNNIPHTDFTYNLQYADHKTISRNNRRVKI